MDDLHDWYVDGLKLERSAMTLFLRLDARSLEARFEGVTRLLVNNFLVQNVIYEALIATPDTNADLFLSSKRALDTAYPIPDTGPFRKIMVISSSIGAEFLVEF